MSNMRLGTFLILVGLALFAGGPAASQAPTADSVGSFEDLRDSDPLFLESISEFLAEMKSGSAEARREAVEDLERSCDCTFRWNEKRVPTLVRLLTGALRDPDVEVRREAIGSVRLLKDARILPLLAAGLKDKDKEVRITASYELAGLAEEGIKEPEMLELLTTALDDKAGVRGSAAKGLGALGDMRAVEPLIAALRDHKACEDVAEALGKLGDPRAVEPLVESLRDKDCSWTAAGALGKLGDKRAVLPLVAVLQKSRNPYLQARVATALDLLGDTRAI